MRDPLYGKILERLDGPLDRERFEACVCALLKEDCAALPVYRGLVPIPGGNDGGMDGASPDGFGEAYPLVCTTSRRPSDIYRNLRDSLGRYLETGGQRNKVVVVVGCTVTGPLYRELRDRARQCDFSLVNAHGREDLAQRLYRHPKWRQELLGLAGDPPALSRFSPRRRTREDLELIGRAEELEWLKSTPGDKLLSGEPGMGKSFLLESWAEEAGALFVRSEDLGRIADGLREHKPSVLILDDAQAFIELLGRLRQLRDKEPGFQFDLVASTWKGAEAEVRRSMGSLPRTSLLRLEPLRGREIVEVSEAYFEAKGFRATRPVLREIRKQSAHRPGLAITLAQTWLRGGWREVLEGEAVSLDLIGAFRDLVGERCEEILACFAVGGDLGLSLAEVARFLGEPEARVRGVVTDLQAGGVLLEVAGPFEGGANRLSVIPVMLRCALLRGVFFSGGATDLDPERLLSRLEKEPARLASAVETLVLAKARGARVAESLIRDLLLRAGRRWAWRTFTAQGEEEAVWALERCPLGMLAIGAEALASAPRATIPRLFEEALQERADRGRRSFPATGPSALEVLRSWAQEAPAGGGARVDEGVRRRRSLAEGARRWLLENETAERAEIAGTAVVLATLPHINGSREDASGDGLEVYWRPIPAPAIPKLEEVWRESKGVLRRISFPLWQEVLSLVRAWALPVPTVAEGSAQWNSMKAFARMLILDLAEMAEEHPGLAAALAEIAEKAELEMERLPRDPFFEWLYPTSVAGRRGEGAWPTSVRETVDRWRGEGPRECALRIRSLEEEARTFNRASPPRRLRELATLLAAEVPSAEQWSKELLAVGVPADFLGPFLERILEGPEEGAKEVFREALARSGAGWLARKLLLSSADSPPGLVEEALQGIEEDLSLVEDLCGMGCVSLPVLEALLGHRNVHVALEAAIGEWTAEPLGEVRDEAFEAWRRAILRFPLTGLQWNESPRARYWTSDILTKASDLAAEWLTARIEDTDPQEVWAWEIVEDAARALGSRQRRELLRSLPEAEGWEPLIRALVQRDVGAFRDLLDRDELRFAHLAPIADPPDAAWSSLARLALEAGWSAREVAMASIKREWTGEGRQIHPDHWHPWRTGFEKLEEQGGRELRALAQEGLRQVETLERKDRDSLLAIEMKGSYAIG